MSPREQQIAIGQLDPVAGVKLAATPVLGLAVDERGRRRQQLPCLAAAVDDAGQLQQLPEPDRLAADLDLDGQLS